MKPLSFVEAFPLVLTGDAFARGAGQSRDTASAEQVHAATIGRVTKARAEGLIDADAEAFLAAQYAFALHNCPQSMAELAGIAEGLGLSESELFIHLHLGTLQDLKQGALLARDGCSAWATSDGPDGPLVVKNRDFSGVHLGVQRVFAHTGPDLSCGPLLCIGSLGSPGAYSSGMNAKGLALVDTQVSIKTHAVGWLRYFLMTHVLATCASVDEAVRLIRKVPHAGGGTLLLADRSGATAAIEIGAQQVTVETGQIVWRTNHFVSKALEAETLFPQGDTIAGTSKQRSDYLGRQLPGQVWSTNDALHLMGRHRDDAPDSAPLCQHAGQGAAQTISSAVYSCRFGKLTFSDGNPCAGKWQVYTLPA